MTTLKIKSKKNCRAKLTVKDEKITQCTVTYPIKIFGDFYVEYDKGFDHFLDSCLKSIDERQGKIILNSETTNLLKQLFEGSNKEFVHRGKPSEKITELKIKELYFKDLLAIVQTTVGTELIKSLMDLVKRKKPKYELVVKQSFLKENETPITSLRNSVIYISYDCSKRFFEIPINGSKDKLLTTSDTALFHEFCHAYMIMKEKIEKLDSASYLHDEYRVIGLKNALSFNENKYREQQRERHKKNKNMVNYYAHRKYQ